MVHVGLSARSWVQSPGRVIGELPKLCVKICLIADWSVAHFVVISRESRGTSIHPPALIVTLIGSNCPAYQVAVMKRRCAIQRLPSVSYRRPSSSGRVGGSTRSLEWSAAGGMVHVM